MNLNKLSNFAENNSINNNIEIDDSHVFGFFNLTMMQQHLFSIKCGWNKRFLRSMTHFSYRTKKSTHKKITLKRRRNNNNNNNNKIYINWIPINYYWKHLICRFQMAKMNREKKSINNCWLFGCWYLFNCRFSTIVAVVFLLCQ